MCAPRQVPSTLHHTRHKFYQAPSFFCKTGRSLDTSLALCTTTDRTQQSHYHLPLIVEWPINVISDFSPTLSKILCNINDIINIIMGNSGLLMQRVPHKGARIDSVRRQALTSPWSTFVMWDVEHWLSGMIKHHLWSEDKVNRILSKESKMSSKSANMSKNPVHTKKTCNLAL